MGLIKKDKDLSLLSTAMGSANDIWASIFKDQGRKYRAPKLVLFSGRANSGCGIMSENIGPFYCPSDEKVYVSPVVLNVLIHNRIPESRNNTLAQNFAKACVVAHEVGHHVQKIVRGGCDKRLSDKTLSKKTRNNISIKKELAADYLAGVWVHHAVKKGHLELDQADWTAAITFFDSIGDDSVQQQAHGFDRLERFAHGTSLERTNTFLRGFCHGSIQLNDPDCIL